MSDTPKKIAIIGDYLPRKCGIATFTHDVYKALHEEFPETEITVVPVNDVTEGYLYPQEVRYEIIENDIETYERTADFLNFNNIEVASVQHEFGIYGGPAGSHLLSLLRRLQMPIVTNLHTILEKPNPDQKRVMQELIRLSSRFIVMTERGKRMLKDFYSIPEEKVDVIPHGIPDMPFVDPSFYKDQFGVEGKKVILTFGLLSPGKGIENVISTLPKIVEKFPDVVYIILGATHPNLLREQGEAYRMKLERLASDLGVKKHVAFYNRFVDTKELTEFLGAADLYITPYLNPAQIVSGTLSYAFGSGKAVISTPYWHAEELLADESGILVPFGDGDAIANAVIDLLSDDMKRNSMRKRAYMRGREMVWNQAAHTYMTSFQKARKSKAQGASKRYVVKTLENELFDLPTLRLDHLEQMTDSIGMFQHATYSMPNFCEGYCADDNARGLVLTSMLEETEKDSPTIERLANVYAAFMNYAFNAETGRFHNFMSFDRRWLEEHGSEDSHGRALWSLGACMGRSRNRNYQMWAMQLFESALPATRDMHSPRTWAFTLIGIHEYFRRLSGDSLANEFREMLALRLVNTFDKSSSTDWPWFEHSLTYDNAKLSHALILSGRWMENSKALDIGLRSLKWLTKIQTSENGHFRPIGSNGFYTKGKTRAQFDQQPVEAHATVSACLEAYQTTQDIFWLTEARKAFDWFLGRNDLGLPLYNPKTGACCDALHMDRINQNQGAESTLAFLLSLQEMRIVLQSLESYERPVEEDRMTTSFLPERTAPKPVDA
ncbi:MAG: glycosyltransferase family 4 protein [Chthoniobacterales bacterium]